MVLAISSTDVVLSWAGTDKKSVDSIILVPVRPTVWEALIVISYWEEDIETAELCGSI